MPLIFSFVGNFDLFAPEKQPSPSPCYAMLDCMGWQVVWLFPFGLWEWVWPGLESCNANETIQIEYTMKWIIILKCQM